MSHMASEKQQMLFIRFLIYGGLIRALLWLCKESFIAFILALDDNSELNWLVDGPVPSFFSCSPNDNYKGRGRLTITRTPSVMRRVVYNFLLMDYQNKIFFPLTNHFISVSCCIFWHKSRYVFETHEGNVKSR